MTQRKPVRPSDGLANVRYEIRGKLARRALELERLGYDIVSLNIGKCTLLGNYRENNEDSIEVKAIPEIAADTRTARQSARKIAKTDILDQIVKLAEHRSDLQQGVVVARDGNHQKDRRR